jgi:hypothetical protein
VRSLTIISFVYGLGVEKTEQLSRIPHLTSCDLFYGADPKARSKSKTFDKFYQNESRYNFATVPPDFLRKVMGYVLQVAAVRPAF